MAHFVCMAWSNNLQFGVTYHAGVPLIMFYNSDGVNQILAHQSSGFRKLIIKELHVTPLAGHFGV